jgi:hypothetical protein
MEWLYVLYINRYTVKKGFPSPERMSLTKNSPWPGIIKLFPALESLVSDIPAGGGKISNLFYSVGMIPSQHMDLASPSGSDQLDPDGIYKEMIRMKSYLFQMEWHSSAMSFSASFFIFHTDSTNSRFSAKQQNIYFLKLKARKQVRVSCHLI